MAFGRYFTDPNQEKGGQKKLGAVVFAACFFCDRAVYTSGKAEKVYRKVIFGRYCDTLVTVRCHKTRKVGQEGKEKGFQNGL